MSTKTGLVLGQQLRSAGDFDRSIAAYQNVISEYGENEAAVVEALAGIAEVYWLQRNTGLARDYLLKALHLRPSDNDLRRGLGLVRAWDGEWQWALAEFYGCVRSRGRRDDRYLLGWAHWMLGEWGQAESVLLAADQAGVHDGDAMTLAADIFQIDAWEKSSDYARQAVMLVPKQPFYKKVLEAILDLQRVADSVKPSAKY